MKGTSILIVEDETDIAEAVSLYLYRAGYQVQVVTTGQAALEAMKLQMPGLVILDNMLPGLNEYEITRYIRDRGNTPIIILTSRHVESDHIPGLEMDADDYVVKPFKPQELVNRVRDVFRRTVNATEPIPAPPLVFQTLRIDPSTRQVHLGEKEIILTAKEFDMLWLLACHPRQIFTREQLLEQIWGQSEYIDPGTVTVHIRRLREKIEIDPANPIHIQTAWGIGYKFEPE